MSNWVEENSFYRVSVKALIRNDAGEILLVNEKNGEFSLPGGGIDHGESVHAALQREMYEELALTSDFKERVVDVHTRWVESKGAWLMWVVYEIDYDELQFSIGEHADEVKWLAQSELDPEITAHHLILKTLKKLENQQ